MSGGHLSKEFFDLVKSIGESRSKQEEDKIISSEIVILKNHLSQKTVSARKKKEYMIRAVYCEMLGHDANFAYIHAVKLAHEKALLAKRIGYLTCNLFLHKDHELMLLMISTMQGDLQSANHLEVCAALTAVSRLVNSEMVPAIAPLVFKLLSHQQENVRKKAIVAVTKFFQIDPQIVETNDKLIRKVLCDPDPAVMGGSLHVLHEMAKATPSSCKDLVPSLVSILRQIIEHRLPRDFDYHRMPAPWLQVKILSVLGVLGVADKRSSEQMYDVLQECMSKADSGVNVGYAIIYECVRCITRIYPDHSLLELAASNISRFISSENHNLKYLGVTGLAQIVQVDPAYAAEHQMVVVECLEDPDESLKRKTLDLLFRMTNPQNATVVVERLTFHMRTSVDKHLRQELANRIVTLVERFSPDNEWYVNTMNTVFENGGDLVPQESAYNLMRNIAEGTGEDEAKDEEFRAFAVNTYLKLLEKPRLSDILMQVIAWVLGEYARLSTVDGYGMQDIIDLLCEAIERPFEDPSTKGYIVNALTKLVGQNGIRGSSAETVIRNFRTSRFTDLQQRCYEFEKLYETAGLMQAVFPYDASCEDITVHQNLPFLDAFVRDELARGARPYQNSEQRATSKETLGATQDTIQSKPTLNFSAYEVPTKPFANAGGGDVGGAADGASVGDSTPAQPALRTSGPRNWGPGGWNGRKEPERPAERPAPRAEPAQTAEPAQAEPPSRRHDAARVEAPKPSGPTPEELEKRRMAAMLFSGVGGAPAATPAPSRQQASPEPTAEPTPPPSPRPQPPQPPQTSLLSSPELTPAPAPATGPAAGADSMGDLLDLDVGSAVSAALAPAPPPARAGSAAAATADLMCLDEPLPAVSAPLSTPAPQTAAQAPQAGADDLLLLDMSCPEPNVTAAAPVAPATVAAPQHLLAPLQVNTAFVGQNWGALSSEQSVSMTTSCLSCQDMMARLQSHLNVHPVEIIGMEGIAAGRVLPGGDPCFLHGKLAPPRLDVKVRCQDPGVARRVADLCARALC